MIRLTVNFDLDIDGDLPANIDRLDTVFTNHLSKSSSTIMSEDHGEGDAWAIEISKIKVVAIESLEKGTP